MVIPNIWKNKIDPNHQINIDPENDQSLVETSLAALQPLLVSVRDYVNLQEGI